MKTWVANEILFAADLNAEFANLYTSGEDLSTPATKAHDMDGNVIVLDADGDTKIGADATDDRIDLILQNVRLFRFDGATASVVNGWTTTATIAGSTPTLAAQGSDTDIGIDIRGKGAGRITIDGARPSIAAQVFGG